MKLGRRSILCAGLAALLGCAAPDAPQRILLIVVDTLRRDHLSCYGGYVETPNIDALAARGQLFANATASFHQTTMSMAALFTGRTPSLEQADEQGTLPHWSGRTWCGMSRFRSDRDGDACIPWSVPTLAEALEKAGYLTAAVVTNPLLFKPAGYEHGFELWQELRSRVNGKTSGRIKGRGSRIAEDVNQAARDILTRHRGENLFLYLHYMDVHDYRAQRRSYAAGVELIDASIGELVAFLDEEGMLDDSVIVLTSDHGERLNEKHLVKGRRGHIGNPSFEEVLRVPLIISPATPASSEGMVRSADLFGLIARIAGTSAPEPHLLEGGELFLSELRWRTYRKGRWKSYAHRKRDRFLLFDLSSDPAEQVDVAGTYPAIAAEHRERVAALVQQTARRTPAPPSMSAEDLRRLEAVGYLE